jgi:hypothetical protein
LTDLFPADKTKTKEKGGSAMAFEKFTKRGTRITTPKAAIWKSGQIGFNQGAMEQFKLTSYNYVVLYYDKDTERIGVEFTDSEENEGVHKLVQRKGSSGTSVSARSFLKNYNIDSSETRQYDLTYDKQSSLYVFNLPQRKK